MIIPLEDLEYIRNYPNIHWNTLKNKKIFITGASGFFGIWIVTALAFVSKYLSLNIELYLLGRDKLKLQKRFSHLEDQNIRYIEGDITDSLIVFPDCDYVIHAAASSDSENYSSLKKDMLDTLILGTLNLFEFYSSKKNKPLILNVSSGGYYGNLNYNPYPIKETDLISNLNISSELGLYSVGKIVGELYANIYSAKYLKVINARCFAFVGPHLPLNKHFAIGNFIRDVINDNDIVLNGDGSPIRSYLYMSDLVVALIILMLKGKNSESYNIGSDEPISILDLAKLVNKISSKSNEIKTARNPKKSTGANYYLPNIDKLKSLGFNNFTNLELSIKKTIKFYKNIIYEFK